VTAFLGNPQTLSDAEWPAGSDKLRAYATGFARFGSRQLIANVRTRLLVLVDGGVALPLTVNESEPDNSYVCSPYNTYVVYSRAELHLLHNPRLRAALVRVADVAGEGLQRARIDQMVVVNNWLLSTNLYPEGWLPEIHQLTRLLTRSFPEHYICFRSLNGWTNGRLQKALFAAGYKPLGSRQVYAFDRLADMWVLRSNVGHDRRLLRQSSYRVVDHDDLGEADYARIASLYDALYRRKYPAYNPAFTEEYIRLCHREGVMRFMALRDPDGRVDGVVGLFAVGRTLTCPIVGYDIALPRRLGLYRMLMLLPFSVALEEGLDRVNLSAGAASFKRLRGGRPVIEYSAVYDRHLSPGRRFAVSALALVVNGLGIPMMRRLQL
jgi:hypothetical protein